jgi:hypothetical protein
LGYDIKTENNIFRENINERPCCSCRPSGVMKTVVALREARPSRHTGRSCFVRPPCGDLALVFLDPILV